jgi:SAM-dependent methyltransferase
MVAPGALVDVGAGAGGFAAAAEDAGFDVTAIEMNVECCSYMTERLGVRAICTDQPLEALMSLPPSRVVTFWHVLEHLPDPAHALSTAAAVLEPGGVLAFALPNPDSLQFRTLRSRWAHLDAPRHVCLASPDALVDRASKLGFEPLLRTTIDPSGVSCNVHGWVYALLRDPSKDVVRYPALRTGLVLTRAFAPLERRGMGAAISVFMRKSRA